MKEPFKCCWNCRLGGIRLHLSDKKQDDESAVTERLCMSLTEMVKTPPFHGGNAGSIPARATMATKEGTKIQQGASPYEETAWPSMLKWME